MANSKSSDFVIVGAGIMGLTLARELKRRYPSATLTILERESTLGKHASGRNSGVLHQGMYYPPGSLKAKLCTEGARELAQYCIERKLPYHKCGKVIVSTQESPDPKTLDLLLDRGLKNGAKIEKIDATQLKELEPEAHSFNDQALFSPETAVISSKSVLESLRKDLESQSVRFEFDTDGHTWRKNYGHFFNCAGLYADSIAHQMGVGLDYKILPFKGLYYGLDPSSGIHVKRLIYPVPNLEMPFLGVHFTLSHDGKVYLGPTAIPALGRENYGLFDGISSETPGIFFRMTEQYFRNRMNFRAFAHQEMRRYFKPSFAKAVRELVPRVKTSDIIRSDKVGIRAQLMHGPTGKMVMDFLVEKGKRSTHILNAVSPGFTSSMSFARYVVENYLESGKAFETNPRAAPMASE